jgi:hypothetical protein
MGDKLSSTYTVYPTRLGRSMGGLVICLGALMIPLVYLIGLPEMGFDISYIMSDYPLFDRLMYLFIRITLIFFPPFAILAGLFARGKGPWVLKEIVLEPGRIIFRRKDENETVISEINEVKHIRIGLQIRGRTATGKRVIKPIVRAALGEERFTMFKSDLERLYRINV